MPSAAAQDEFNALFYGSSASHSRRHPEEDDDDLTSHSRSNSSDRDSHSRRALRSGNTNRRDSDYEDEPDHNDRPFSSATAAMKSRNFIPSQLSNANTGPKGVIADAQAFAQARRAHRRQPSPAAAANEKARHIEEEHNPNNQNWFNAEASDDESYDDDFMTMWRQARLRELASGKLNPIAGQAARRYGSLTRVNAEGFLDAVERAERETVVVVFIYDDASEVSSLIEQSIRSLARKYAHTRFVKLHYVEAEIEVAGVPAILAYRGGDKFAGMVPVMDELSDEDELTSDTLAAVLKRHRIL